MPTIVSMERNIQLGSRVYLRNAICGEPGCVMRFTPSGKAVVSWPDLQEVGETKHDPSALVLDEGFTVRQIELAFDEVAA